MGAAVSTDHDPAADQSLAPGLRDQHLAADRELQASENRFRRVYEEAAVGMVMLDMQGTILDVNRTLCEISGYASSDLIGQPMTLLLGKEHEEEVARALEKVNSGTRSYRAERRLVRRDGASIGVRNSVTALDYDGKPRQLFVLVEDITEGKQAIQKLEYQAAHEEVTGLYNRRYLEDRLSRAIENAQASGTGAALLYLDLDGFKLVNDTLGHATGDEMLREVGSALTQCVGAHDVLARLGGDEFAAIIPGGDVEQGAELASKMLAVFQQSFKLAGHELRIGASIGVVTWPADGATAGELMQNADAAMYSAKHQGRNRYATFTSDLRRRASERLQIENQIRNALAAGEFHAEFQPIQETRERKLVRFETVCRWKNARLGEVSPMQFIPVAEETGIIVPLGQFMVRQACSAAAAWSKEGMSVGVSVNVSGVEFARSDFADSVRNIVEETRVSPQLLELELNECVFGGDTDAAIDKVQRLRDMGIRVTLDNFGTGQSSLSHLGRIPVTALKIDRMFIADLERGPNAVSLVRSIIGIANSFGLRVLADGVENEAQLRVLRFLGCHEVQGFFFGKPEPLANATARLREARRANTPSARANEWMSGGRLMAQMPRRLA